jgi:hypothetical protein
MMQVNIEKLLLQEAGDTYNPPWPVNKEMVDFFNWYESHKNTLHPLLAAETQPK